MSFAAGCTDATFTAVDVGTADRGVADGAFGASGTDATFTAVDVGTVNAGTADRGAADGAFGASGTDATFTAGGTDADFEVAAMDTDRAFCAAGAAVSFTAGGTDATFTAVFDAVATFNTVGVEIPFAGGADATDAGVDFFGLTRGCPSSAIPNIGWCGGAKEVIPRLGSPGTIAFAAGPSGLSPVGAPKSGDGTGTDVGIGEATGANADSEELRAGV